VALYIVRREDEQIHGLVLVRHQERQGVAIHQEFLEKKKSYCALLLELGRDDT
jgi:hypothetical protein